MTNGQVTYRVYIHWTKRWFISQVGQNKIVQVSSHYWEQHVIKILKYLFVEISIYYFLECSYQWITKTMVKENTDKRAILVILIPEEVSLTVSKVIRGLKCIYRARIDAEKID